MLRGHIFWVCHVLLLKDPMGACMIRYAIVIAMLLGACRTPETPPYPSALVTSSPSPVPGPEEPKSVPLPEPTGDSLYDLAKNHLDHSEVKRWIDYFSQKDRDRFQRFLNRGAYYREYMEKTLESKNLPKELYYLAMIESGFYEGARSHAGAVGVWQFIRGTARRYGLSVNSYVDERRDPERATEAAVAYLADLYRVYNSWWLAIASYNSGEMRVFRAIMKKNTRDFFSLVDARALPRETSQYVPKFIAALHIGENYSDYGFTIDQDSSFDPDDYLMTTLKPRISLREIAKRSGCGYSALGEANRSLIKKATHSRRATLVRVPKECLEDQSFADKLTSEPLHRVAKKGVYRVRRGDNLASIAKRLKTSVRVLKSVNGLRSSRIYPGQKLAYHAKGVRIIHHRVRRGESLYEIAKRYNTSVRRLKEMNRRSNSRIYSGEVIKVAAL